WLRRHYRDIELLVARLLSVFEGDDDRVTGRWEVGQWKSQSLDLRTFFVSGHLSVLYRYPGENRWKAILNLTYNRGLSKTQDVLGVRRWYNRLRGNFFEVLSDVEITGENDCYHATTATTFRNPDIQKSYQGVFDKLVLEQGRLIGEFRNTTPVWHPEENPTDVIFHQRKKWREFPTVRNPL
ncbi:hypothetical protein FJY63_13320, partial [Candidatus Sumerlaeota bacterium]|nr:hypothetical protein [Candidatus Sumerlaeota bacterium]